MIKSQYIKDHPRSILSRRLAANDWPDDAEIWIIVSSTKDPNNFSDALWHALKESRKKCYTIGGKVRVGSGGQYPNGIKVAPGIGYRCAVWMK